MVTINVNTKPAPKKKTTAKKSSSTLKTANDVTRLASNVLTVNKKLNDTKAAKEKKAAAKPDAKKKAAEPAAAPKVACPGCGGDATGAAFCPTCGRKMETALKRICSGCGSIVESPSAAFCPGCGAKME